MKRNILLIQILAIIIMSFLWPDLQKSLSSLGGVFARSGSLSILVFLLNIILSMMSAFNQAINIEPPKALRSMLVRIFVGTAFVLGIVSLTSATEANIPSSRGLQAFLHLVALLGASMIVADFIRSMTAKIVR